MSDSFRSLFAGFLWLLPYSLDAGEIRGTVRLAPVVNGRSSPAVVYVETRGLVSEPPRGPVVVDQRGREFIPRVQATTIGASIIFRNSDAEAHNVNSRSGCCDFNRMVGPHSELEPMQPAKPGLLQLLCNIHHHMRGYVMVCPNTCFAVTDAAGRFRIEGVPDGPQRIAVWQEFSKPLHREITVDGETHVEFELEASVKILPPAQPVAAPPIRPWTAVRKQIASTLEAAMRAARRSGGASEAERLAFDAYFEHFEASGLETAVRLYCGEQRVFDVEQMFGSVRKPLLAELAAGRASEPTVRAAIAELLNALDEDIAALHRSSVFDRTSLGSGAPAASRATAPVVDAGELRKVVTELRAAFDEVERLAAQNPSAAAGALASSYFDVFHRIEPALLARNASQVRKIEGGFLELRGHLQAGMAPDAAKTSLDALLAEIDRAVQVWERSQKSSFAAAVNGFSNAFVILTREAVEALLIITALLLYLNRIGQPDAKRTIYAGLVVALAATGLTWLVLQWVIGRIGVAQEIIEGIVALIAAGVLFYVSYWLISKSEARRWQEFLTRQAGKGVSTGSQWALGLTAFLAVYREGAETILMFQPLLVHPAPGELLGVFAGMAAAVAALVVIVWALRFATVRLAIRPFFRVTGALLFGLAVVFAGKGVTELQEAEVLTHTLLPPLLRSPIEALPIGLRDALGLGLTKQSLLVQGTILGGAVISMFAVWLIGRLTPIAPAASVKPAAATPAV